MVSVGVTGKVTLREDLKDMRHYPPGCLGEVLSRQGTLLCKGPGATVSLLSRKMEETVWDGAGSDGDETGAQPDHVGLEDVGRAQVCSE